MSERADPAGVVRARRVVGEVEVDDEPAAFAAEVGALDRVKHVAATAVCRRGCRRITLTGRNTPPPYGQEPPDVEIADAGEVYNTEAVERDDAIRTRSDVEVLRLDVCVDLDLEPKYLVVSLRQEPR